MVVDFIFVLYLQVKRFVQICIRSLATSGNKTVANYIWFWSLYIEVDDLVGSYL